ncbi:TM0106 family RecB-like putative nuclease [Leifsonia sp. Leaf264]|uniref:TM0106 family RecB-like putative nuclease n=1 Tax=Leifsonia sp. Leaf264 TaxID=1736314 RepID=UPI0006FFFB1E|nr:bifunctional RecB family nuclease/DEAD/DEAH box helicase [Leifsonia sp. Leaf264]KQO97727.1 DNA helicase [Leifsonia sp. Leaf264]
MFLLDGSVVTSASDLTNASKCEFAFLRKLDAKLGRIDAVPDAEDAMLARTAVLGDKHENRVLGDYRERFGHGVVEVARPPKLTTETLQYATDATADAFATGADVVFQATFFDGSFVGFADFIVRRPGGVYLVQDTKLARRARVTALLQLAAYADQLDALGVPRADTVELLLGDGSVSSHRVDDILPVYRKRRARLLQIIDERLAADTAVAWGDPRYTVCGRCETCSAEVDASRDVLLVAGMRVSQRHALRTAGVTTIEELANVDLRADGESPVAGMARSTLEAFSVQAALQVLADRATDAARAEASALGHDPDAVHLPPPVAVRDAHALAAVPEPNAGDLFFDFEGDPLYTEGAGISWGIDYLFGVLDRDDEFTTFWAHSFAEEKLALERFLDFVDERRAAHPGLHIYHYASYERTHLLSIAARHGTCEARVDQLLSDGVLIDLYPIVRRGILVGSRSYSIKKLEPLYMGDEEREGVTNAADSIVEYQRAMDLAAAGESDEAQAVLDDIARYNRYDVLSTLRLSEWLLERAAEVGVRPAPRAPREGEQYVQSELAIALAHLAGSGDASIENRTADQTALALASAAIDYYPRERKSHWWAHFFRLDQPVREWEDTRDVLVVDPARSRVEVDWQLPEGRSRKQRRTLRLHGRFGPGTRMSPGAGLFALYEPDGAVIDDESDPGQRIRRDVTVLEVLDDGLVVEEALPVGAAEHRETPMAITPGWPLRTTALENAIGSWGAAVVREHPSWPRDGMVDILRRRPPRSRRGELVSASDGSTETAVVASLLDLDDSYLAVQGPPGTGKTHLASHVIARLVNDHRWKVGVVAQSHSVVENLLDRLAEAGLDPALVGKAPKSADATPHEYTVFADKDAALLFTQAHAASGFVVGGTAWDFANPARFPRRGLDLLVVDEAGQFSLASTVATSVSARNILLLGDPQQLPQVSQGTHPEPVDSSALGWVAAAHDVLPSEFGYFLAESRRMHPAVAAPVSRLSYEGALRSHPDAADRMLDGVDPGLHRLPVVHVGNATESPEEAAVVVDLVRSLLGSPWSSGRNAAPRPLDQVDFIVVTPYNAQLARVREALDDAGLPEVRVGTVDKFQGQEAVVAVVSLAASSAADVPRGMEFLIMKNRLNVAISRAQWAAYLVYSPELTEYLPVTSQGVAELSAFIRLVEE